jgi:cob(I)alamin adenosyltransferase
MKIYTKTGDSGKTSLYGGKRVYKSEALVDVYGSVDELNSWIGLLISSMDNPEKQSFLQQIQADLLSIGSVLAGWESELGFIATRVTEMEVEIDAMEVDLPALQNFILPGGTVLSAHIHIVRSICRRVERQVVALSQREKVDAQIIQYLNRLSDLFFVLARFINRKENISDVVWSGIKRKK